MEKRSASSLTVTRDLAIATAFVDSAIEKAKLWNESVLKHVIDDLELVKACFEQHTYQLDQFGATVPYIGGADNYVI